MTTAEQRAQLRELAERATQGDWRRASTRFNGITATPFSLGAEEVMLASTSEKRDAEFIAAFHPAVSLALLDEHEKAVNALDVYRQRIAELEARTVTVKLPESVIDAICLTAAEIHNLGRGVSDERAQEIINSIRCAAGINLTVEG